MDDSVELAEQLLEEGSLTLLVRALDCRLAIGQAMGIAMERHELDEDQALQFLGVRGRPTRGVPPPRREAHGRRSQP